MIREEAIGKAIKALEQEPCEYAVSSAEVIDELNRLGRSAFKDDTDYDNFFAFIEGLSPVTPAHKEWIPVSDRLPEKNVEVLATTSWDAVTIAEMYSANDWFIHEGTTNAETDEIVAWMPLPEPYKAESEGEK